MNYLLLLAIITGSGIISLITYFIIKELKINRRLSKIAREEKALLRAEIEYDRNEAIRRGLLFFRQHIAVNQNVTD